MMEKRTAVVMAYQIATLAYSSDEVFKLLMQLPFERILDLMLIMRQSPKQPIRSPLNFLRRALAENWSAETMPKKVCRKDMVGSGRQKQPIPVIADKPGHKPLSEEEMEEIIRKAKRIDGKRVERRM